MKYANVTDFVFIAVIEPFRKFMIKPAEYTIAKNILAWEIPGIERTDTSDLFLHSGQLSQK